MMIDDPMKSVKQEIKLEMIRGRKIIVSFHLKPFEQLIEKITNWGINHRLEFCKMVSPEIWWLPGNAKCNYVAG